MAISLSHRPAQVIDLETMRQRQLARRRLVRLSPELDGLEMVYQPSSESDTHYCMPVLAWGLREDGDVVGLVAWMETLTPCHQLDDPDHGKFIGYRDPETEELLDCPPEHKVQELQHSAAYFDYEEMQETALIQQIPENHGTHALCMDTNQNPLQLKQVFGWHLYNDGRIEALLADEDLIETTPVLPGDACLYPGHSRHAVVYLFQRDIANSIRNEDAGTMEALAMMVLPKGHDQQ